MISSCQDVFGATNNILAITTDHSLLPRYSRSKDIVERNLSY